MSDLDKLFGSDSEDEGGNKDKAGSNSPSGSSNSGSSSSGSDNESNRKGSASPAASNRSAASSKSAKGSGPASPAASNSGSDSESGSDSGSASGSSKSGSAAASPAQSGSAPGSPPAPPGSAPASPAPASPAQSGSAPASPAQSGSAPASPAQSGSAPASPAKSGSAPASPAQSKSAPASPAPPGSAPASPTHSGSAPASPSGSASAGRSGQASPTKSASPSSAKSGSPPGSPGSQASSGSKQSKSSKKSGSRSPAKEQNDSDSDIPTKGRAKISDDSDSEVESKPRQQRLPSDSGSDPEAVRATAEDIFGEADDISDDEKEKEQEPEEKEEVIPETRIEVEIPKVVAGLGERLSFAKLPNFLSVETRPFDPVTYEDEIDEDEVMDEEGRARLKLKVENTIRWRNLKDSTTNAPVTDEFGENLKESNAKVVKWSDGSLSLHLGTETFDMFSMPMQDHNHLYIRQGTGLQGQAMFKNKLSFRPHSTDSFTHRKMTMSLADRSSKTVKIKVLPIAGVDPELSKTDNIKKEEERLRASVRRENQQRRTKERGYSRGRLEASLLDEGVSLNAIKSSYKKRKAVKSRDDDLSDSADEEYETDGEDDLKHTKLQRAKRLDDSDENSDSNRASDGETIKKKSKVMSGSDSD